MKITEAVLLAVIDWVLRTPEHKQSARTIFKKAKQVVDRMKREACFGDARAVEISKRHLPDDLSLEVDEVEIHKHVFQFFWNISVVLSSYTEHRTRRRGTAVRRAPGEG